MHGCSRGDGAHGSGGRGSPRLDAGAPVPLARADDGCRHGGCHLGCWSRIVRSRRQLLRPVRRCQPTASETPGRMPIPATMQEPVPFRLRYRSGKSNQNPAPSAQNSNRSLLAEARRAVLAARRTPAMSRAARASRALRRAPAEAPPPAAPRRCAAARGVHDSRRRQCRRDGDGTTIALSARRCAERVGFSPRIRSIRWRVVGSTAIERSTDGGKTWTKTVPLPASADRPAGRRSSTFAPSTT